MNQLCCIKNLLGPKAKAKGIVCDCPTCRVARGQSPDLPEDTPGTARIAVTPHAPSNGKMAAAHDDTEQGE
jgi:hypothetical protein